MNKSRAAHFDENQQGRDFVVGDIHGYFDKLAKKLDDVKFNESVDRLFSVGDLVDRGPNSAESIDWLAKPWFHAVRGNHEQMAIDAADGMYDAGNYIHNGGKWFLDLTQPERYLFAKIFSDLPIAIDIKTCNGLVGIVHAECPCESWEDLLNKLENFPGAVEQSCMWSRDRITSRRVERVKGLITLMVGHTPLQSPQWLGNVHYIDTGACFGRELTVIELPTKNAPRIL